MPDTLRVAAVQFNTGADAAANLTTLLRMLDEAAAHRPDVVVTPEFCNYPSIYDDAEHAWQVAIDLDGEFAQAVAGKAREHGFVVMTNATVRRERPRVTDTNLLFGRDGTLLATSDKQVLMGGERFHIDAGTTVCPIVDLDGTPVAMYSCMDGVINETPRALALRGAHVLLNSLNSFALDEATLHIPVRAAENKVWVVAANKVGPLLPPDAARRISEGMGVPEERLVGAGESQVVAPDGTVVAIGPLTGEAVVVADIDPAAAADKRRPDGTDVFANRRPALYAAIGKPPSTELPPPPGAGSLEVAVVSTPDPALVAQAVAAGARLVVLPELAEVDLDELAAVAGEAVVVTSVRDGARHVGVAVTRDGVIARQPQLHASARHPWLTELGDALEVVSLPWGRLAVIVGDDAVYPESFRLAALQHAEVVAVPFTALEAWETHTGLLERAAENRLNVVAATRPTAAGASLVLTLNEEPALWGSRAFDGTISYPIVARADGPVLLATVHPAHAAKRLVSRDTDLVDGRPWQLVDAIVGATP